MNCSICNSDDHVSHLDLYIIGSEGVYVCLPCRIVLSDLVRGMMQVATKSRKYGYLACKKVKDNNNTTTKEEPIHG